MLGLKLIHFNKGAPDSQDSVTLQWHHNGLDGVSNHQPHHCLLSRLFGRRSKKTSKLRVTGLCVGNSPGTGEFPAQMASNAENVSIWWRHHEIFPHFMSQTWTCLYESPIVGHYFLQTSKDPSLVCPTQWGIILCMRPANERRRYIVKSPLIGWTHTQNDPCTMTPPPHEI